MRNRRQILQTLGSGAAVATLGVPLTGHSQAAAVDTLRIIIGFPPGGTTDAFGRALADKMRGHYANTALVDNKPGAGGQIGVSALRDGPADGTSMLLTPASMLTIYPYTYPRLPYKVADVTLVSTALYTAHAFGVGPMVPASVRSLKDYLTWAQANPTNANYGTPGAGSMPHLVAALLEKASGVPMKQIPYKGSGPGIQDLIGGQVASFSSPMGDYLPHLASGRLRLLAVSGPTRSKFAPEVPTYAEQGFGELTMREWYGVFVPSRTPTAVVQRANAALRQALALKELHDFGAPLGLEVIPSATLEEAANTLKTDSELWGPFVKRIGFTAES